MDFTTLVLIAVVLGLLYLYGKSGFTLFKRLGIKGPPPRAYVGNLFDFGKTPPLYHYVKMKEKYGGVCGLYFGPKPVLLVTDLELIHCIEVKDFSNFVDRWTIEMNPPFDKSVFSYTGHDWRRVRNIVSPTFSGGKLRLMCGQITQCARVLRNNFLRAAKNGQAIETYDLFSAFTMDVIALTAFGLQLDSQNNPEDPFVHYARKMFDQDLGKKPSLFFAMIFPCLRKIFKLRLFPLESVKFFCDVVEKAIEQRKESQKPRVDFLQLLVDAEWDESETTDSDVAEVKSKRLTTEEIVAQAFLFFIAGYETTATTLKYASHELCLNPDVQEKLLEEIRTVLGDDEPDYDSIKKLTYMEQVVQETLRMYPPAPVLTRTVNETKHIHGVTFHKDMAILIPTFAIQRDPRNYPNPEVFDPDRFAPEAKSKLNPYAFQPFGQGPRMCVGMRLALVEAKIALVHVIRSVKFVRCPETQTKLDFMERSGILSTVQPIVMKVEARETD